MLYEFKNYNKHGNIRTRVVSWPNGKAFGINPSGLGGYIGDPTLVDREHVTRAASPGKPWILGTSDVTA